MKVMGLGYSVQFLGVQLFKACIVEAVINFTKDLQAKFEQRKIFVYPVQRNMWKLRRYSQQDDMRKRGRGPELHAKVFVM